MKLQERSEVEIYCPACKRAGRGAVKLVVRTNRQNKTQFLGCPNWPDCEHTEPIPEALLLEAAGAARLPGF
jgi:ssDNA-binding Zn-finger/Zn-ribbon topoisomerase 1